MCQYLCCCPVLINSFLMMSSGDGFSFFGLPLKDAQVKVNRPCRLRSAQLAPPLRNMISFSIDQHLLNQLIRRAPFGRLTCSGFYKHMYVCGGVLLLLINAN